MICGGVVCSHAHGVLHVFVSVSAALSCMVRMQEAVAGGGVQCGMLANPRRE